jgi:hypothetical protein
MINWKPKRRDDGYYDLTDKATKEWFIGDLASQDQRRIKALVGVVIFATIASVMWVESGKWM